MSQGEAVPEDSPCSRRPPFLKQAAALRTQIKEIHKLVPRKAQSSPVSNETFCRDGNAP